MTDISEAQKRFDQAQAELKQAQQDVAAQASTKKFATLIHDNFCKKSHEDGFCGWEFEIEYNKDEDPWDRRSHKDQLEKAVGLLAKFPDVPYEQIAEIMLEAKRFL